MVTIDETPGNLAIKNTPTTSDYIRQVEPNHTERIFGVRMAATAQMKTEYTYQLEHAIELVSKNPQSTIPPH